MGRGEPVEVHDKSVSDPGESFSVERLPEVVLGTNNVHKNMQ